MKSYWNWSHWYHRLKKPSELEAMKQLHLVNQQELKDLVRDLELSKKMSELLNSRLQEWNLLAEGKTISHFRVRHAKLSGFYETENNVCFCTDINGLMEELGYEHHPEDWRLFIDSSKDSLRAFSLFLCLCLTARQHKKAILCHSVIKSNLMIKGVKM